MDKHTIGNLISWIVIMIVVTLNFLWLVGCSTPPWSDRELEQMGNVNCVPIIILN